MARKSKLGVLRCVNGNTYKPTRSMYAIYAYIGVVWGVNVGIYSIHGVYGKRHPWGSLGFVPSTETTVQISVGQASADAGQSINSLRFTHRAGLKNCIL